MEILDGDKELLALQGELDRLVDVWKMEFETRDKDKPDYAPQHELEKFLKDKWDTNEYVLEMEIAKKAWDDEENMRPVDERQSENKVINEKGLHVIKLDAFHEIREPGNRQDGQEFLIIPTNSPLIRIVHRDKGITPLNLNPGEIEGFTLHKIAETEKTISRGPEIIDPSEEDSQDKMDGLLNKCKKVSPETDEAIDLQHDLRENILQYWYPSENKLEIGMSIDDFATIFGNIPDVQGRSRTVGNIVKILVDEGFQVNDPSYRPGEGWLLCLDHSGRLEIYKKGEVRRIENVVTIPVGAVQSLEWKRITKLDEEKLETSEGTEVEEDEFVAGCKIAIEKGVGIMLILLDKYKYLVQEVDRRRAATTVAMKDLRTNEVTTMKWFDIAGYEPRARLMKLDEMASV